MKMVLKSRVDQATYTIGHTFPVSLRYIAQQQ